MLALSTQKYIEELVEMPNAFIVIHRASEILENEKQKRLHFYAEVHENQKAEFINGSVVIHSPVRKWHNETTGALYKLCDTYSTVYDLGFVGIEKIMISLTRNDYEPDICFFSNEKAKSFTDEQVRFPAPDFVVEVLSPKTENIDRNIKFNDYQAHEVEEYWIIDPETQIVEQYHLENGEYKEIKKSNDGTIKSFVIKGFEIPIQAIFNKKLNVEWANKLANG